MKACRVHQFGDPEVIVLEEIAQPLPHADQVVVRVRAAGVGPWDALVRSGRSGLPQPLPLTLGSDLAGTVTAVGSDVTGVAVGDAVFGCTNPRFVGAYAEFAAGYAGMVAPKPRSLDFDASAGVPVVAVTALQMLTRARIDGDARILVLGAAGSVGRCIVQLAARRGLTVVAAARSGDASELRELGADETVDIAGPLGDAQRPVAAIFDTVGGDIARRSFANLAPGGSFVSVVEQPDAAAAERTGAVTAFFFVDVNRDDLTTVAAAIDAGELHVRIGAVLPLTQARVAHEMLAGTRTRVAGKIVLHVADV